MPAGCSWPAERPWRVCQQAAAMLGRRATRRVLRLRPRRYAQLLAHMALSDVASLARDGELIGLHGCTGAGGAVEVGAAVVGIAPPAGPCEVELQRLVVSGLFVAAVLDCADPADGDSVGLRLVAAADVASRYSEIVHRHLG
jgi:hypothetical protein